VSENGGTCNSHSTEASEVDATAFEKMDRLDALKNKGKSDSLLDFANKLSFKEKKVIQDLFKICDIDGDGAISKAELGEVFINEVARLISR
jgi:Ca2+-binding EF-hand superfamily protein